MTMVTDPTLDDDRWGLFVRYKHTFSFENNDYDVPESYFYRNGEEILPNTIELVQRFLRQVRESRGYDVDCIPPRMFESPFLPVEVEELRQGATDIDRRGYDRIVRAAESAIQNISQETGHSYKLVKVERAVMTRAFVMFLTLTAEEEDAGPVPTIQAAVYCPVGGRPSSPSRVEVQTNPGSLTIGWRRDRWKNMIGFGFNSFILILSFIMSLFIRAI